MHIIRKYFTLQKFLFIFCITLISSFCLLSAVNFLTAYANVNESDENHDRESRKVGGGPSMYKTAWLCYFVTEDGKNVSDVVLCNTNKALQGKHGLSTRIGEIIPTREVKLCPWEPKYPFNESGGSMCGQVKAWFLSNEESNAHRVITDLWGEDKWQKAITNDYKIIIEPVEAATIGGDTICANDYNWGKYLSAKYGANAMASSVFNRYTNGVFPGCCKFERDQVGLVALGYRSGAGIGGRYTNGQMATRTNALGIMLIELKNNNIHTYFKEHGSPGQEEKAQPNKIGKYNMVKVYYTKYMKNGVLKEEKQDGSPYVEPNCVPSISVDDEPNEYHLEHWSSNTDFNPSVDYKTVRSMHGPQSGNGAKIVKLSLEERNEKTVYVVLVRIKDEKETKDYNYLMTQSMITRTIWFNYPDNKKGMTMMSDDSFTWSSPAHPDKCAGHEHTHKTGSHIDSEGHRVDDYTTFSGACTEPKWKEHTIKFSLYNDLKKDSPDIVANRENLKGVEVQDKKGGTETKRWEPLGTPEKTWGWDTRQDDEMTAASKYNTAEKYPWDYICVIMRGDDKLTVAKTAG